MGTPKGTQLSHRTFDFLDIHKGRHIITCIGQSQQLMTTIKQDENFDTGRKDIKSDIIKRVTGEIEIGPFTSLYRNSIHTPKLI